MGFSLCGKLNSKNPVNLIGAEFVETKIGLVPIAIPVDFAGDMVFLLGLDISLGAMCVSKIAGSVQIF